MEALQQDKVKIFSCIAIKDKYFRDELEKHLKPLTRQYQITHWHDSEILPGANWERSIDQHLDTANIVLLLISPDFMASEYCYGKEMQRALARHNQGTCHVIPILLRPADWESVLFASLQILPDTRPVSRWADQDDAFHVIVKGIRIIVESLLIPDKKVKNETTTTPLSQQSDKAPTTASVVSKERTNRSIIDLCIEAARKIGAYDHPVSLVDLYKTFDNANPDVEKGKTRGSFDATINYYTINMRSRFPEPQNKRKPASWQSRPTFKRVSRAQYMLLSAAEIARFNQLLKEDDPRIYQDEYDVDELFRP